MSAPSALRGRRGCGLEARLLRKEQKLKLQTQTARSHRVSRDGAVQSYFVPNTLRGALKPRYSVRFSSRRDFGKRLDVVKDRVTSPLERKAVGSIPTRASIKSPMFMRVFEDRESNCAKFGPEVNSRQSKTC